VKTFGPMKSWFALGVALLAGAGVHAQGSYPDKPITLIVPFPPGIVDANARVIATKDAL
jgi:tripartite-type tricarboxylate transporter receptor subunit TctC